MINSFPVFSFASGVDVKSSTSTSDVIKEDNIYQKAVDVLGICGIVSKRDKDNYVTNQEFALSVVQLLNMSNIVSSGSEIEFLKESKIIPDSMRFLPDTIIMTDEALEICVNALGYREKAQHTGYEKIISETDLNSNIAQSGKLTHENLTLLLYNALIAPLNEIISIKEEYFIYNNDCSILNTYHQIYCICDIILASDIVAVKNYEKYISKDRIYMDGLSIRAYNSSILNIIKSIAITPTPPSPNNINKQIICKSTTIKILIIIFIILLFYKFSINKFIISLRQTNDILIIILNTMTIFNIF